MHIYSQNLDNLKIAAGMFLLLWTVVLYRTGKTEGLRKLLLVIDVPLILLALYGIFSYSVLGRTPSDNHVFTMMSAYTNEFYREMFMNALLYCPLGLFLSVLIGPWSILASLILSVGIEAWQYFAGTGLAQGTDVLCNTLGCAAGVLPWLVNRWLQRLRRKAPPPDHTEE